MKAFETLPRANHLKAFELVQSADLEVKTKVPATCAKYVDDKSRHESVAKNLEHCKRSIAAHIISKLKCIIAVLSMSEFFSDKTYLLYH